MDKLITFLRARYDDLEAKAPSEHFVGSESQVHRCPAARDPEDCGDLEHGEENCDCGLTARRAYALADMAAKRQIIGLCATETDETGGKPLAIRALLLLASPFVGHPGYDEIWRA